MNWNKPILTDSGGFQVFSLSTLNKITEEGVRFQSHIDGSYHMFTPEKVMEIENAIGADIIMSFDECTPYPADRAYAKKSADMTIRWAKRSKDAHSRDDQALFGIVQGSVYDDLRVENAKALMDIDFPGYSIGGLSVGEPKEDMYRICQLLDDILPQEKPRYLMGVGKPEDLVEGVYRGIDMFDCVLPTRNARKGTTYTWKGKLIVKAAKYKEDFTPIDENCTCYACRNHTKAYIRHLLSVGEPLGMTLLTIHSLHFFLELMEKMREAIENNEFSEWRRWFYSTFVPDSYPEDFK